MCHSLGMFESIGSLRVNEVSSSKQETLTVQADLPSLPHERVLWEKKDENDTKTVHYQLVLQVSLRSRHIPFLFCPDFFLMQQQTQTTMATTMRMKAMLPTTAPTMIATLALKPNDQVWNTCVWRQDNGDHISNFEICM